MLPVLHVARLELGKLRVTAPDGTCGNHHVIQAVVSHEDLWVAEIHARIVIVGAIELPERVFGACLEVWRGGAHHGLCVFGLWVMAGVIDIIETILLVIIAAASTKGSILLEIVLTDGQKFTHRLIVAPVGSLNGPDGVETECLVVNILLQIEDTEGTSLRVVERHRVSYTPDSRRVVSGEPSFVGRDETLCGARPVFGGVTGNAVVTAGGERGDATTDQTCNEHIFDILGNHIF